MFRCFASSIGDEVAHEAPRVHLYFDRPGLANFAQFLKELADNPEVLKRMGHVHFRDQIHPQTYHLQQESVDSKDILIMALPETSSSTEGAKQ